MARPWRSSRHGAGTPSGGAGWPRAMAVLGVIGGALAVLAWALRDRRPPGAPARPSTAGRTRVTPAPGASPLAAPATDDAAAHERAAPAPPMPAEDAPPASRQRDEAPHAEPPSAGEPTPETGVALTGEPRLAVRELWVLDGELQATLANEGDTAAHEVEWAMRLVPGYDADNDYGGEQPPVIEATGGHDGPIDAGAAATVTLTEAPAWYLDVRLHPMQLRARYRFADARGATREGEQSARLVLFHVRSRHELQEIRDQHLG